MFSPDILPPANDPNDIQVVPLQGISSLSAAVQPLIPFARPAGAPVTDETPHIQYAVQLRPGIYYDTGYIVGNPVTFSPPIIALDGTPDAHKRGQITFADVGNQLTSLPIRFQGGLQVQNLMNTGHAQAYIDAPLINGHVLQVRTVLFRSERETNGIAIGKAETVFGDLASVPTTLASGSAPVGSVAVTDQISGTPVFTGVPQVRYTYYWSDRIETTASIEDQNLLLRRSVPDVTNVPGVTILNRWPVVVGRVRYSGENGFDSYQIGALLRPVGFDDAQFNDHFATGWGVSGTARFSNEAATDAILLGAAGGRGLGGYIFGGTQAALIASNTQISTLSNFGAYGAYQHVWYLTSTGESVTANLAYGCVRGDSALPGLNHELHQAWANLLWNATDSVAYGLEYQYGLRTIGSGNHGDDHRIMFVLSVATGTSAGKAAQKEVTDQAVAARIAAPERSIEIPAAPAPARDRSMSSRRL